jgi:hypothetical protein
VIQETNEGKIDLPEDEPAIIKLLMQYLYQGNYVIESSGISGFRVVKAKSYKRGHVLIHHTYDSRTPAPWMGLTSHATPISYAPIISVVNTATTTTYAPSRKSKVPCVPHARQNVRSRRQIRSTRSQRPQSREVLGRLQTSLGSGGICRCGQARFLDNPGG